jgi:hypothetical protein
MQSVKNLRKKKAREDGAPPAALPAKGTSSVKEHYSPPREQIPEVDEAVLLDAWWPDRLRRQAVVGVDGVGTGAGGFAVSGALALGGAGARSNSTSFSDLSP